MIVYTAIYGGYDTPKPPRPHPAVTAWMLFTDDQEIYAPGWTVIFERRKAEHPRMAAKWLKCHPPEWPVPPFPPRQMDPLSLYLDASIRLRDPSLIDAALAALLKSEWAMYPHPERTTIEEEVEASRGMAKYRGLGEKMDRQVAWYRQNGRPSAPGLWAGGIIARRSTEVVRSAGARWYADCERWTYQDQVSLPVVLEEHGISVEALTLGGSLWQNPHFAIEPHRSDL